MNQANDAVGEPKIEPRVKRGQNVGLAALNAALGTRMGSPASAAFILFAVALAATALAPKMARATVG